MTPEKPTPYKPSEEKIQAVTLGLLRLRHLQKFPETEAALQTMAKAYAKFVRVKPTAPDSPWGETHPLDWLIDEIAEVSTRFLYPIEARKIYETRYPSVDGRNWEQMVDQLV